MDLMKDIYKKELRTRIAAWYNRYVKFKQKM